MGALAVVLGIVVVTNEGKGYTSSTVPTDQSVAESTSAPQSFPKRADERFDVTPSFQSLGSFPREEEPYGTVERYLTLDSALDGLLLKITVNSDYTPTGAATTIEEAQRNSEPAGLKQIVSRSCVTVVQWNAAHEVKNDELTPVGAHLEQHGLDVSGTLLYPAVLPGEYEWGCSQPYKLGYVTTPNLGDAKGEVVFQVHRSATDTVIIVGLHSRVNVVVRQACIAPTDDGTPYRPSHITIYHTWTSGNGPPYLFAGLRFPVGTASIKNDSFYAGCHPGSEEGVALTSSSEVAPSYEFVEKIR